MPIYTYSCTEGHEAELLRDMSVETVSCSCGARASRGSVNRIAVIGQVSTPRDERKYRHTYGEYREAVAEVNDSYERVNQSRAPSEQVKEPNYMDIAKSKAVSHGASILKDK